MNGHGTNIIMLQGTGNNERGWARLVSKYGTVGLFQQGLVYHVEFWKDGNLCRAEETRTLTRRAEDVTFGAPTISRSIATVLKHYRFPVELIIAANYAMTLAALALRRAGRARKVVSVVTDQLPEVGSFARRV